MMWFRRFEFLLLCLVAGLVLYFGFSIFGFWGCGGYGLGLGFGGFGLSCFLWALRYVVIWVAVTTP